MISSGAYNAARMFHTLRRLFSSRPAEDGSTQQPTLSREEIERRKRELIERYAAWTFDVPLGQGVWSVGDGSLPHTRLKRLVQIVSDLSRVPFESSRILDLGCLDGLFSIEFALQGAREVVGLEVREANLAKCELAREGLGLTNVRFVRDDVRNVTPQKYGTFDTIICSGILYHLNAPDVFEVLERLSETTSRLLVIDTLISLAPDSTVEYGGNEYRGRWYPEHQEEESEELIEQRLLTAHGNRSSFWLTRPSLVNFLQRCGFTSVYECFNPPHINFGQPGIESRNRCTFVAVRGEKRMFKATPAATDWQEFWPEGTLDYVADPSLPLSRGGG